MKFFSTISALFFSYQAAFAANRGSIMDKQEMKTGRSVMKCCVIFIFMIIPLTGVTQNLVTRYIHSNWKFKQERLNNWYPASVPGVVHTDLLANKIIEDPFFRLNERGVQWIDKEDWIYETTFDADAELIGKNNIRLVFEGLDTYADVYLNEQKIISADNMFRSWQADVKTFLEPGKNVLRVYFHSPVKVDLPKLDDIPYFYHASNDQSQNGGLLNKKVSVFARKAGYHYGWDWGPRLVTSGIWRPVLLEAWDDARIEDVFFRQENVNKQNAAVTAVVEIISDKNIPNAILQITTKDFKKSVIKKVDLKTGLNKVEIPFSVKNPKLWWSNGLGAPHLYNFTTSLSIGSKLTDKNKKKIGLRSVKIINEPDKYGKSFYVELNGQPVFAKGANYIPNDMFLPRVTEEKYEKVVRDAVDANMNMLRVWGGGIYENDIFYDLCDQYGILVWQDFMYACSMYPAEGALLENMKQEAIENVRRLRNHPAIALWCGNNEINDAWFTWGWKRTIDKINPEYSDLIWKQYVTLFHNLLPEVVKEHAPQAFYWPGSPYSEFGKPGNDSSGDMHYWRVWHHKEPIQKYNEQRSRFFSEYGFQSFPEFESVKKYAPEEKDWDIYSEVMMSHQRGGVDANGRIEGYLTNEYRTPKNFPMFLYMNQVLQGDAIKTAIEAHRRDMPYCMGTLYWQHNDVWPVASWSARDYYGRWKAQQYFARDAFKDMLVSPIRKGDQLNVYIVSDRLKPSEGTLNLTVMKLTGEIVNQYSKAVAVPSNSSHDFLTINITDLLKGVAEGDVVIHAAYSEKNAESYTNDYFLVKQKDVNYPATVISTKIRRIDGGYELELTSNNFARAVFISLEGIDNFFENNYFNLLPQKPFKVKVQTKLAQAEFEKQLKVVSLVDGYSQ